MSFGTSSRVGRVLRVACLCGKTDGSSADAQRWRAASWSSEDISLGVLAATRLPRPEWQRARSTSWVELGKNEGHDRHLGLVGTDGWAERWSRRELESEAGRGFQERGSGGCGWVEVFRLSWTAALSHLFSESPSSTLICKIEDALDVTGKILKILYSRSGEVFAYVGLFQNLKDLKDNNGRACRWAMLGEIKT